jgi:hypothetical protein
MTRGGRIFLGGGLAVAVLAVIVATQKLPLFGVRDVGGVGGPTVMRRLTQAQYRQIVADVFGPDIKIGGRFEPDLREGGLIEIGAGRASIPASGVEQYANMARSIAAQVLDDRHRAILVGCAPASPTAPDERCARQFIGEVGRLLYRRKLTDEELVELVAGAAAATEIVGDFYSGLKVTLASMLESPQFLFTWEAAEPHPRHEGLSELDAYSKAARLSFFLWDTAPDLQLLEAAERGQLDSARGVALQVDRLMASPRLESGVRAFFSDMLGLDGFESLSKDPVIYPQYSSTVALQAREQTLRTVTDHLLARDGDYRDLFTTRKTYLSRPLGAVYDISVPPDAAPDGWQLYEWPKGDPRAGILMQISFLALHSHPGRSSPTLRGKALRETILCQKVPDPPGNVNFNIVQDTKDPHYKTVRQRLTAHRTQPTCAGCHKLIDPVGLGMENFDSIGAYRATENDAVIDPSGELDGVAFKDAIGLGQAVHDHPATPACLVQRLYGYAVGRSPSKSETEWLRSGLQKDFAADGYRLAPLLRRIATSEAFFGVAQPDPQPTPARSAALDTGEQPGGGK